MDGLSCGGNTLIGPSKSGGQLCNPWSNSGEAMAIPAFDFWSLSKQDVFVIPSACDGRRRAGARSGVENCDWRAVPRVMPVRLRPRAPYI
ncbi:MAG: hypothetical protein QF536_00340 [Arenicellales bacterium]|jgi:hypothetical protein|nr:hypothetical protein [Arenicellales bacterium]MDP6723630.1 hypothetical protein [Arenicellales bacterium]